MLIFIFCHYKSMAGQPEFLFDWDKKQYYSFLLPTDAICEIWQELASEMSFENVDDDGWTDYDRQTEDACLAIL